jgi:hypothetical protein
MSQIILDVILPDPLQGVIAGLFTVKLIPVEVKGEKLGHGGATQDLDGLRIVGPSQAGLDQSGLFLVLDLDGKGKPLPGTMASLRIIIDDESASPAAD